MQHDSLTLIATYKQLLAEPAPGACTTIYCSKVVPETLIAFHRTAIHKVTLQEYRLIFLEEMALTELFAQLSITFLGRTSVYALKDGDLSPADRKRFDHFLRQYKGPHTLYFFTSDVAYEKQGNFLETVITQERFKALASAGHLLVDPAFTERLFVRKSTYSFDEAYALLTYAHLLGVRHEQFFTGWVHRITTDDVTLFTLSQHFFAGQKKLLIHEWAKVKERYPVEFWVAYFSEQLWQALLYTHYAYRGRAAEAKRFVYRLPFSYFQKDWKRHSVAQLLQAYRFLYEIDYGLKNGYATHALELFVHSALNPGQ